MNQTYELTNVHPSVYLCILRLGVICKKCIGMKFKLHSKVHVQITLDFIFISKVCSGVLSVNHTERYFHKSTA